jgi:phosphatidylinositol alpha-1,6-mannosyltransferase
LPEVLQKIPNLKYLIVGKGPEKTRLESIVRELGIQERVIFTGFVEHTALPSYYCLCDLFTMPSCVADENFESFGIVFAEASACGKPVIGSKTGGISDAVVDGVTGLLVEPNDVKGIGQALISLLTDGQLALTIGKNGRARVENELTWRAMGERIVASLQKLKLFAKNVHHA